MGNNQMAWSARTKDVMWRRVGDDIVLMDLGPSVYHSLRGTGAEVWVLLQDKAKTLDDLVSLLLAEYDVDEVTLRNDVASFLDALRSAGLATATEIP